MYIVFNPNNAAKEITLPEGEWHICINAENAGTESLGTVSGTATVDAISALVLVQGNVAAGAGSNADSSTVGSSDAGTITGGSTAAIALLVMAAALAGAYYYKKKAHH